MKLYSIGYGVTRTIPSLVEELRKRRIKTLIDCRTNPFSRYNPAFSRTSLENGLRAAGITYTHNKDLGGKQDFGKPYLLALERLADAGVGGRGASIALMCSELDPRSCHRYKRIGEDLAQKGIQITHIDKDDSDLPHPSVSKRGVEKLLF